MLQERTTGFISVCQPARREESEWKNTKLNNLTTFLSSAPPPCWWWRNVVCKTFLELHNQKQFQHSPTWLKWTGTTERKHNAGRPVWSKSPEAFSLAATVKISALNRLWIKSFPKIWGFSGDLNYTVWSHFLFFIFCNTSFLCGLQSFTWFSGWIFPFGSNYPFRRIQCVCWVFQDSVDPFWGRLILSNLKLKRLISRDERLIGLRVIHSEKNVFHIF